MTRSIAVMLGVGGVLLLASMATADVRSDARLAFLRAREGDFAAAESLYFAVLVESPTDVNALTNLGNLAFITEHPKDALEYYDKALSFDSTDPGIRLNRALVLASLGQHVASLEEASEVIRMSGTVPAAESLLNLPPPVSVTQVDKKPRVAAVRSFTRRLTNADVRRMLRDALERIPLLDTLATSATKRRGGPLKPLHFQSAGALSGRADTRDQFDPRRNLYWRESP